MFNVHHTFSGTSTFVSSFIYAKLISPLTEMWDPVFILLATPRYVPTHAKRNGSSLRPCTTICPKSKTFSTAFCQLLCNADHSISGTHTINTGTTGPGTMANHLPRHRMHINNQACEGVCCTVRGVFPTTRGQRPLPPEPNVVHSISDLHDTDDCTECIPLAPFDGTCLTASRSGAERYTDLQSVLGCENMCMLMKNIFLLPRFSANAKDAVRIVPDHAVGYSNHDNEKLTPLLFSYPFSLS